MYQNGQNVSDYSAQSSMINYGNYNELTPYFNARDIMAENHMVSICAVLASLGIPGNYKGFLYLAYATKLSIEAPERILLITKWIYPDVARRFNTTVSCVERDIRLLIHRLWCINPNTFSALTQVPLNSAPTNARMLSMLYYLISTRHPEAQNSSQSTNLQSA